jgi:3-phenylpropionate/trans-cinnamate dioxygenase ferredoxin subunit
MPTPDPTPPELDWFPVEEAGVMGIYLVPDGGLAMVKVEGHVICLARRGEELFAVRNRCPHAGGPLHQGWLDAEGQLVCPWHRFKFCLDKPGEANADGYRLHSYPWRIVKEELQIGFPKKKKLFGWF